MAPRINWRVVARDLAGHLANAGDLDVARRILSDAAHDAANVGAPAEFWAHLTQEYERAVTARNTEWVEAVAALIRSHTADASSRGV